MSDRSTGKRRCGVYIQWNILNHKKGRNKANCSNLEIIMWSQKRKINNIWCHLYVGSKTWHKRTFLQNRNRLIEHRLVLVKEGGGGGGKTGWKFETSVCKLLDIRITKLLHCIWESNTANTSINFLKIVHSFLLMTSIPLYRCTAVYSLMHLLMDTWVCPVWGYHEQSHYDYSSPSLCYGEKI